MPCHERGLAHTNGHFGGEKVQIKIGRCKRRKARQGDSAESVGARQEDSGKIGESDFASPLHRGRPNNKMYPNFRAHPRCTVHTNDDLGGEKPCYARGLAHTNGHFGGEKVQIKIGRCKRRKARQGDSAESVGAGQEHSVPSGGHSFAPPLQNIPPHNYLEGNTEPS